MRVYVSSTSEDLERHRTIALEVAREVGFEPIVRDPAARRGLDRVEACGRQVDACDLLLAIVGWRVGEAPGPALGGDGARSWAEWEVARGLERGLPVTVLMADSSWPESSKESDSAGRAEVEDFRGELDPLAVRFGVEPASKRSNGETSLRGFRELVRRQLEAAAQGGWHTVSDRSDQAPDAVVPIAGLRLRRWSSLDLPGLPYPLLLPYSHPDLMAGRERELAELRRLLTLPVPILGLYAASGAGKSSLLAAGLVPRLRAEGRPVAFDRHPCEPGLTSRLIGDLLASDDGKALEVDDEDVAGKGPEAFVERMLAVRQMPAVSAAGSTQTRTALAPVLILDQFEDLLLGSHERRARALVGSLLAASVQRRPGLDGPTCRWLLTYRQESHGKVVQWLADVLREARAEHFAAVSRLPHDLSGPDRFHGWPLPPLGAPRPGSNDRLGAATKAFLAAIEKPLELIGPDGTRLYPWSFANDGAARLARAFGAARMARPAAPLAPELQVVLAHLLEASGEPAGDQTTLVMVPEEPGGLIDEALEQHLRRTIDAAFPVARPTRQEMRRVRDEARIAEARLARTRAVLVLRELADDRGRRDRGLPVTSLARAIDARGDLTAGSRVLERLAMPRARLVVLEQRDGDWLYVLSHDRLAELLVRLVDEEGAYAGFGVDAEMLALRRFVRLKCELFSAGETERATEVPADHFQGIERHAAVLLWDEESELWWRACRARRRDERRRNVRRSALATVVALVLVAVVWRLTDLRARRMGLLEEVALGEPETAFRAADRLLVEGWTEPEELRAALRLRDLPLDVLERGIGGVAEGDGQGDAVLRVAELTLPLITEDASADPVRIASLAWALDFFAPRGERTRGLRDRALEPLRRRRPPPPVPPAVRPATDWVDIPAGTFRLRRGPGTSRAGEDGHRVTLSAFRIGAREVTNLEFRRLFPAFDEGKDDRLPAAGVTWYQAYTYAAWLGGRLPTEAEAEYAKRAGCAHRYCRRDGSEATLDEVAWWAGNSRDPETGAGSPRPVGLLEPNPWGLYDAYGNILEPCADWYGPLPKGERLDPPGPTSSETSYRTGQGGAYTYPAKRIAASGGGPLSPGSVFPYRGVRVVLPTED